MLYIYDGKIEESIKRTGELNICVDIHFVRMDIHDRPWICELFYLTARIDPNYLVFYRLENDAIEILRVRHGMMHLPELFAE